MIVDVHTHLWERPEQMGLGNARRLSAVLNSPLEPIDTSLKAFDRATEPVTHAIILGFASRRLDASISHEQLAQYVGRNPRKFIGFAGIDPMADDFLESLDKATELGLAGVVISPPAQGFHPTHTRAMRLYERCAKGGLPIMVHQASPLDGPAMMEFAPPQAFDEVGRSFPDLRMVFSQVGHPWVESTLWLIAKHAHFYADLADVTQRPWQLYNVLLLAHELRVASRLLLGSDFPFCTAEKAIMTMYAVNHCIKGTNLPTIPREEIRGIVERDVLACLGLSARPAGSPTASGAASGGGVARSIALHN